MPATTALLILVGALAIDALVGYPKAVFARIGHPVTWIGRLIGHLDNELNHDAESPGERRAAGILALVVTLAIAVLLAWVVQSLLAPYLWGQVLLAVLASTLIAGRSLYDHVREVAEALEKYGLSAGRTAVAKIVGRNPATLDEEGVARASIESLAENASDGVVAPALWFALLGLPGIAAYKAINTADSMIGHRTARHKAYGWASARLDDLVNLPASRMTAALLTIAAYFVADGNPPGAVTAIRRDAPKHRSPNAGWPESAMAGALGLKLNGPKTYGDVPVDDAYMGDGRRAAGPKDIRRALRLSVTAWGLLVALTAVGALILQGL